MFKGRLTMGRQLLEAVERNTAWKGHINMLDHRNVFDKPLLKIILEQNQVN